MAERSGNPSKDKYRLVKKTGERSEVETDVNISGAGRVSTYISYVAKLFHEKDYKFCNIKATGQALSNAVTVAEVLKRRFKGLHQTTKIGSTEVTDVYEPKEEGLDTIEQVRMISFIDIKLSLEPLDEDALGYQPPLPEDQVEEKDPEDLIKAKPAKGKGKGKGKGKKGKKGLGKKGKGKKGKGKGKKGKGKKGKGKGKKGKGKGKKGKGLKKKDDDYEDEEEDYEEERPAKKSKGKGKKGKKGKSEKGSRKGSKKGKGKRRYEDDDDDDDDDDDASPKGKGKKGKKGKGKKGKGKKGKGKKSSKY